METLKRHVLSLGEKEYMSLKEIVVTFEEKIYYAAKSQGSQSHIVSMRYWERVKDQNVVVKRAFKENGLKLVEGHQDCHEDTTKKLNASVCCEFVQKCDGVRTDQTHGQYSSALNDEIPSEREALVLLK